MLQDNDADVFQQGEALLRVAEAGNLVLVQQLLNVGVSVDSARSDGCTALWLAAEGGHAAVCNELCLRGASINATKVPSSVTPLYVACQNGHRAAAQALLAKGANPSLPKDTGSTPLHIASQQGFEKVCELLIDYGARVTTRNDQDMTPLHLAALLGHTRIVQLLIEAGSDPFSESQGKTTLEWASNDVRIMIEDFLNERQHRPSSNKDGINTDSASTSTPIAAPSVLKKEPFFSSFSLNDDVPETPTSSPDHWYHPQYLLKSASGRPRKDYQNNISGYNAPLEAPKLSKAAELQKRSVTATAAGNDDPLINGHAGFTSTHVSLLKAIADESAANERFRRATMGNPHNNKVGSSEVTAGTKGEKLRVRSNAEIQRIESEWLQYQRRLEAQARNLNETNRGSVPVDAWMYTSEALRQYKSELNLAREQLVKSAQEDYDKRSGRAPSSPLPPTAVLRGSADERRMESLRQFFGGD